MPTLPRRTRRAVAAAFAFGLAMQVGASPPALAKSRAKQSVSATATSDAAETDNAAFVYLGGTGILRISDAGVEDVLQNGAPVRDLRVDRDGSLWISLQGVGVIRIDHKRATTLASESFAQLAVLAPDDVWAINDSHGSVVHYEGSRFKTVRTRNSLPGAFDDNRLLEIVSDERSVWLSGWNGLWRVTRGRWNRLEAPTEVAAEVSGEESTSPFPLALAATASRLIACYSSGCFAASEHGWRTTAWPVERARLRAVGTSGVLAGVAADGRSVVVTDSTGTATSQPIFERGIHDVAVDAAGRVWVASDAGLTVLDAKARVLEQWTATRPGDSAIGVERIVVAGKGPAHLPRD